MGAGPMRGAEKLVAVCERWAGEPKKYQGHELSLTKMAKSKKVPGAMINSACRSLQEHELFPQQSVDRPHLKM